MMKIGAPNSIARYASETTWGENEFAVFEYVYGENGLQPVVRAAGSKQHCQNYMKPDRILVNVKSYGRT